MKISKKWKKCQKISSFNTRVPKIMIKCFTVPEIWRVTDVIVIFHFGLFFPSPSPPSPPPPSHNRLSNENFKKRKKHLEILSFYTIVPKIMIRWCTVPEIWCVTDGRKMWLIEVGASPRNMMERMHVYHVEIRINETWSLWKAKVVKKMSKHHYMWRINLRCYLLAQKKSFIYKSLSFVISLKYFVDHDSNSWSEISL